jgi:hypothetical protein
MTSQALEFGWKWLRLAALHSKFSRQQIKVEGN